MLDLYQPVAILSFTSCAHMMREANCFNLQPLNWQPVCAGGIETIGFFVVSRLSHDRLMAKSGPDDKKPDALIRDGAVDLLKVLRKTRNRQLTLAAGTRKVRVTDEFRPQRGCEPKGWHKASHSLRPFFTQN